MASPWLWMAAAHVYKNRATGVVLGPAEMLALREAFVTSIYTDATAAAARFAVGPSALGLFRDNMRTLIKSATIDQYLLGHGGRATMTFADWGHLGYRIRGQYGYLERFVDDIGMGKYTDPTTGKLNLDAIRDRASMYMDSTRAAYEQGRARGMGLDLPAYPGDGTVCRCRCSWDILEFEDRWEATWVTEGDDRMCAICDSRGSQWAPYVVHKGPF